MAKKTWLKQCESFQQRYGLSSRAANVLIACVYGDYNVEKPEDWVRAFTNSNNYAPPGLSVMEYELLRTPNCGKRTAKEIVDVLGRLGLAPKKVKVILPITVSIRKQRIIERQQRKAARRHLEELVILYKGRISWDEDLKSNA